MPPISVNVKRTLENQIFVIRPVPYTLAFDTAQLPVAGEVLLMVDGSSGEPTWVGKASWTLLDSVGDSFATYRLWGKVSDGTETGITITADGGFYMSITIASMKVHPRVVGNPLTEAVHSFTSATNSPLFNATMTTPTIAPDPGKTYDARMEFLTGNHAVSDTPHPSSMSGGYLGTDPNWYRLGWLGNTALGNSTVGWYIRSPQSLVGEEWFSTQGIQVANAWLVDIPAGGWEINKVAIG